MRDNINKVAERGERLDSLESKTDNLAVSAQGFRRGANRVRKQMWWKVRFLLSSVQRNLLAGYENAFMSYWRNHNSSRDYHWYICLRHA